MRWTVCPTFTAVLFLTCGARVGAAERPNIIMLLADDLGYGDVGFNGNSSVKTPNLDAMASRGLTFRRFYSQAPQCSPTRASVLTGRNGIRTGIEVANDFKIVNQDITIAELARAVGYTTGHFGKWHVATVTRTAIDMRKGAPGNHADYSPPWANGYDSAFTCENWMPTYDPYDRFPINNATQAAFWTGPGERVPDSVVDDRYTADIIMEQAIAFIEGAAGGDRPIFATIWFTIPHTPIFTAPDDDTYAEMPGWTTAQKNYFTVVTAMDRSIGRLRARLEALGIADTTLLLFTSDNGPEANGPGLTGGFRGRKNSLYEGGVRVPTVAEWPGVVPTGAVTDHPATTSDYLPTLLDLWDIGMPDPRPLDGESFLPVLMGVPGERRSMMKFRRRERRSIVDTRYKLITNDSGSTYELYDLIADPLETSNLRADPEHADRIMVMRAELESWLAEIAASRSGADYDTGISRSAGIVVNTTNPLAFARGLNETDLPVLFVERQLAALPPEGLAVDSDGTPGTYSGESLPPGHGLESRVLVDSFLLHLDPPGEDSVTRAGSIVFENEIVAVIASGDLLVASDFLGFADPEFELTPASRRTLVGGELSDTWSIDEDRHTFSFELTVDSGDLDEIRILTEVEIPTCFAEANPPRVTRALSSRVLGAGQEIDVTLTVTGSEIEATVVEQLDPALTVSDPGTGTVSDNTVTFAVSEARELRYALKAPEECPAEGFTPIEGVVRVAGECPSERLVSGSGRLECDACPGAPGGSSAELVAGFVFGARDSDCTSANDPSFTYTVVRQVEGDPLSVAYDSGLGFGYEVLYSDGTIVTDPGLPRAAHGSRGGWEIYGPFDRTPNNRTKYSPACPESIYDSFIGCTGFLEVCDEALVGNRDDPCPRPDGIVFRVDVPSGLYRFVAAVGDSDNPHAHRIIAENGGAGPPAAIGPEHVVLVGNFDQAQQTIGEGGDSRPGEGVFARIGFDGNLPPRGDGVFPDPQFVNFGQNGVATTACPKSPTLAVTEGHLRIHQLQGNANPGPGSNGQSTPNGGDLVLLELWRVGDLPDGQGGLRVPGDCNSDATLNVADPVCFLSFLFQGKPASLPCGDGEATHSGNILLMDANGDASIDLSDAVYLLTFLFVGGPPHVLAVPDQAVNGCAPIAGCAEECG